MTNGNKPGWGRHLVTFLIVFALLGMMFWRGGCQAARQKVRPQDARVVELKIGQWRVLAEVADTPELHRRGLQNRPQLERGYGMLFIFEQSHVPHFWMKDTTIPLSIAFIREDGTAVNVQKMEPQSERRISPEQQVKYALEMRQGWFEERALKPPFRVEIPVEIPPPPPPPGSAPPSEPEDASAEAIE